MILYIFQQEMSFDIILKTKQIWTLAKSYMDKGELVPDQVTIDMLGDVVANNPDANGFIFDGFPRNTFPLKH